jgi:hypothetical protein
MKEVIRDLLDGKPVNLGDYRQRIETLDLIDYAILKRFNKNPEEYSVLPQHLRARNWSQKYNLLSEETMAARMVRLFFIKVNAESYEPTDIMAADETITVLPEGVALDFDKYFYFFLIQKMKDLYDIFGVKYDQYPKVVFKKPKKPKEKKQNEQHSETT